MNLQDVKGWRYYNNALMPSTPPHVEANIEEMTKKSFWKLGGGKAFLARWTSHFDCKQKTSWWYVIKDTPFELSELKAKRRYEINKGNKNFYVKQIKTCEYKNEIYNIQKLAYEIYPEKYRPKLIKEKVFSEINNWNFYKTYGVFTKEQDKMVGYGLINRNNNYIYYAVHKVMPEYEKLGVNAALVYGILMDNNEFLLNEGYICDGARNILHETGFQDYLEKYFGFRKAYCKLHIKYRFPVDLIVKILYPFRDKISKENKIGSLICGVLKMEEIKRTC